MHHAIATKFQQLYPCFLDGQPNDTTMKTVRRNQMSEKQDGGRQTGSTYISASRLDSNTVPTATPHFRVEQLNGAIPYYARYLV